MKSICKYSFIFGLLMVFISIPRASAQEFSPLTAQIGFSTEKHLTIAFTLDSYSENVIYGLMATYNIDKPTSGEFYETINRDELREDHREKVDFIGFTMLPMVGVKLAKDLYIGATIGVGVRSYRINCFDSFHILGNNGYYNIKYRNSNGAFDYGAFLNYRYRWFVLGLGYNKLSGGYINIGFRL